MKVGKLLALAAILCMVGVAIAQEDGTKKKERTPGLRGTIVSNTDGTLVIKQRARGDQEAKEVTVTTDKDTVVTLDGEASTVGDLKAGYFVSITPVEGTAKKIIAYKEMPKRKPKAE
jgi:hypothetical protein